MPSSRNMTGYVLHVAQRPLVLIHFSASVSTDCNVYTTSNEGCGVKLDDKNSFGPDFNANGGGW